jgi:hypothetical protein
MKTPNYPLLLGIVEICIKTNVTTLRPWEALIYLYSTIYIPFVPTLRLVNWATKYMGSLLSRFFYRVF